MLLRAFLSQNVAIGCAFGGYGVSVPALRERFDAGSGTVSLGLALVVLAMGVLGPLVATLSVRFGLRRVMMTGTILSGMGYVALALAPSMPAALFAFALLVGPGVALFGSLPVSLLAGGWYPEARGRAVGLANMPVLVSLAPLIGLAVIQDHGMPGFYLVLAGLHVLLVPVLWGVRDAPATTPPGEDAAIDAGISPRALLTRPLFWILVLGGGALNATAIAGATHMVAVAVERGIAPAQAAVLASVMGAASVAGSLGIGILCDRLGGARALAVVAASFAIAWVVIALATAVPLLIPAMLVVGACGAGVFPAVIVLCAHAFGRQGLGVAVGLFGMCTLPLTFLLPPAAGLLRDGAGSYLPVMEFIIAGCVLVALVFAAIGRLEMRGLLAPAGTG